MHLIGRHVSRLAGYARALPTPFNKEGTVDLPCFERFCSQQIHVDTTALIACSTTGEEPILTRDERREVVRAGAGFRGGTCR